MKSAPQPHTGSRLTLADVLARLAAAGIGDTRRRDLRSAVATYAKLVDKEPAAIALDLAELRHTLDRLVPAEAEVSAKRWANLRTDLAAAIDASGLVAMLKTAGVPVDPAWEKLLAGMPQRLRAGLSRFARWASIRHVGPEAVDGDTLARFVAELELSTLVRSLPDLQRKVALNWNALVKLAGLSKLKGATVPSFRPAPVRISWDKLPASFRRDVEDYIAWCAMPDPLDEGARARALAPRTRELRRNHFHSAVTAAVAGGVPAARLTSIKAL